MGSKLLFLVAGAATACSPIPLSLSAPLVGGHQLREVITGRERVVVLNPSDCYSCSVRLAQAVAAARQGIPTAFVLTRAPTPAELRQLAHLSIQVNGALDDRVSVAVGTPAIFVVRAGQLVPASQP